ncbi:MAG: hypothetical protein K0R54_1841 [Clostridiaceae bacterium]|jgi:hypothetical protein|nr:hypothetical protein [Clostridiaceae bacterium]
MFNNTETKHPSFGTLSFSRVNGGTRNLFGSSIKHRDTIVMRLYEACIERNLNRDWIRGDKVIAEAEMSYSQFAEAITAMNMGSGVPVTLRYIKSVGVIEECPFVDKVQQFEEEFSEHVDESNQAINNIINEVSSIFSEKKNLTKADKENILRSLQQLQMNVGSNTKFIYEQFNEQMDKTVSEAKGEIEAFIQNKINSIANVALVEHKDEFKKLDSPINF